MLPCMHTVLAAGVGWAPSRGNFLGSGNQYNKMWSAGWRPVALTIYVNLLKMRAMASTKPEIFYVSSSKSKFFNFSLQAFEILLATWRPCQGLGLLASLPGKSWHHVCTTWNDSCHLEQKIYWKIRFGWKFWHSKGTFSLKNRDLHSLCHLQVDFVYFVLASKCSKWPVMTCWSQLLIQGGSGSYLFTLCVDLKTLLLVSLDLLKYTVWLDLHRGWGGTTLAEIQNGGTKDVTVHIKVGGGWRGECR